MSKLSTGCMVVAAFGFLGLMQPAMAQNTNESDNPAQAEEEIVVEHGKINTADASPVDPGHFEIEPSFSYTRAKRYWDSAGDSHVRGVLREENMGVSLTAGVVENLDVNISGGYSWLKDADNDFDPGDGQVGPTTGHDFGDLSFSGRYRFYNNEAQQLEMAYIAGMTIPTGSSSDGDAIGTSQEFWSLDQTLVATKDWGLWTVNVDVGYALPLGNKREDARGTLNSDIALGYQVLPWLQPEVELNYIHDYLENTADAQALAATLGLIMPINELLRVNLGVQQGLWGENTYKATTVVMAVKFAF